VFGGLDRRERFNDLWLFDTATVDAKGGGGWARIEAEGACPSPRGHFSATRFGDRVFVFGGYGGGGQVYGDLWVLHCGAGSSFRWEQLTDQLHGEGPSPRFDHAAFVFPVTPSSDTFDKLVVMGGRDLGQVLSDTHVLDLAALTWERAAESGAAAGGIAPASPAAGPAPGGEVCCAAVEDVESVPYHKVRLVL